MQADDLTKAKRMQTKLMIGLKDAPLTDPKLTQSASKDIFPKRKGLPEQRNPCRFNELGKRTLKESNLQPSVP